MMMMSFGALGLISVLWVLYGYSLAFGDDVVGGLIGNLDFVGLKGLMSAAPLGGVEGESAGIPPLAFVGFQAVFAIITVALISGAIADRAKFGSWMVFAGVWATVVYFPVAHWVFAFDGYTAEVGGWIANDLKAIDFAGGTAVHINAGAAGLALALVLGKRIGFGKEALRPHNLTLVMIGAGLLWFGWFGFNAGSALGAGDTAAVAWINTLVATAAASLAWCATEKVRDGHATSLGAASGVVAGLVAITPACSAVNPIGAILVGAIAGVLCALAVSLKFRWGYDDSLDVVGVHLVGGIVGTLLIGVLATSAAPAGVDGLLYGGGVDQLWRQAVAAGAVLAFSFVLAYVIGTVIDKTIGFRLDAESEVSGVDLRTHAESAYELGSFTGSGFHTSAAVGTEKERVDA
jgi:Amt family ammonium transporter